MSNRLFWLVVFLIAAVLFFGGVLVQYQGMVTHPIKVSLSDVKYDDKYGRILAKVADQSGQDIGEMLMSKGLARPYHGEAKSNWCGN